MLNIEKYCHCNSDEFDNMPEPLFRLVCHCKTCQEYSEQPYNDECTFRLKDCNRINLENVAFKRYQSQVSPFQRGKCKKCGKAAYCIAKVGLANFIMIPSIMLNLDKIPEPTAHVYYDRRVNDINDKVKKVSGHFRSQLQIQMSVLKSLVSRITSNNKR